jgi:hypothetical protein
MISIRNSNSSVEQDKKMTDLIRKLVEDYLEKIEKRKANK